MDFSLTPEQQSLQSAVRGLLSEGFERRAALVDTEPGFDRAMWSKFADMGLLGLPFTEEMGGVGAGPIEVFVTAQEVGRVLAPEPYIDVVVTAGHLLANGAPSVRDAHLGDLIAGEKIAVLAHSEPGARYGTAAFGVTASESDGWKITGVKEPVRHGATADMLLVSAVSDAKTRIFAVDANAAGVHRTSYRTPDGAWAARIEFADAPAELLGEEADLAAVFHRTEIALAAEALGAMEAAVMATVEYLKTRKQFGVTLSKFQALTHRAADLYVSLELTRSVVQWATMALAEDAHPDAAARVKLQVAQAGRHIGEEAIQLHGGIAMTDEFAVGHYTARLNQIAHTLSDERTNLEVLSDAVGKHGRVELLS